MTDNVSRRSLVKGASWAAPVVVSTALVPAYAASMCDTRVGFGGGLYYNFGTLGADTTTQKLSVGGATRVFDLPAGVTVTRIEYVFWIQNRLNEGSYGPGAYYVENGASNRKPEGKSAMTWTPTAGSGFANTVSSTSNLVRHTFSDGFTAPAWDLRMTWTPDANILNVYTEKSTGCRDFDTGSSGRFWVEYSGIKAAPSLSDPNVYVRGDAHITVRLSDGRVFNYKSQTAIVKDSAK